MNRILWCLIFVLGAGICFGQEVRITNISPPAGNVTKIVPDPIDQELIYAVIGDRVYRSENSGLLWKPSNLRDVTALGIDRKGNRIFAATHGRVTYNDFHIWLSTDKAKSFKPVGGSHFTFREIFPHPILSKVLFAFGCSGWDVCASMDRGATWEVFRNLPEGEANYDREYYASGLLFLPQSRNQILLSGRLYRNHARSIPFLVNTMNLGKTWKRIQPTELRFLQKENRIYAYGKSGIFKYIDSSWSLVSTQTLEQMIAAEDNVKELWGIESDFVTSKRTLLKSSNGGLVWQKVDIPFADRILLGSAVNNRLLVGTQGGGFYRFSKGAWTWSGKGIKDSSLKSISFSQTDQMLYTIGGDFLQMYNVKKKSWNDLSWHLIRQDWESIQSVHVDPFNSKHLFLVTSNRLLRGVDGGLSWSHVSIDGKPVFDSYRPGVVYLFEGFRTLAKSKDSGKTFEQLPLRCSQCPRFLYGITIDPFDENVLYFSMPGGIWKSIDGGRTIEKTGKVFNGVLSPLPFRNHYLLLGINASLYKTTDGGMKWVKLSNLIQPISSLRMKMVTLNGGRVIFAAHDYSKLFLSVDGGKNWSSPLPERYVLDISTNSDRSVFVSTATGLLNVEILD